MDLRGTISSELLGVERMTQKWIDGFIKRVNVVLVNDVIPFLNDILV